MIVKAGVTLPFSYASGSTGALFLQTLRDDGTILGTICPTCDRVLVPARSLCSRCGVRIEETVEVGPEGEIVAAIQTGNATHRPVEFPGAFCLVRLDGADTNIAHWLLGDGKAAPGTRVRAVLADKRRGSILDIAGFRPIEERT